MSTWDELLQVSYTCRSCDQSYGFTTPPGQNSYFKFPPAIGCQTNPKILFVGINPRKTKSNDELHECLMSDPKKFSKLSQNVINETPYIATNGNEPHYRFHMRIVEELFGRGTPFERVAVASEVYLCATKDTRRLPRPLTARCADKFLYRVIAELRPKVIVAVGSRVFRLFKFLPKAFQVNQMLVYSGIGDEIFPVIKIFHPADPNASEEEKDRSVTSAVKLIDGLLTHG